MTETALRQQLKTRPDAISTAGANYLEARIQGARSWLMRASIGCPKTNESIPMHRARPTAAAQPGLCLDKDYDYKEPRARAVALGCTLHLRSRGEEAKEPKHKPSVRVQTRVRFIGDWLAKEHESLSFCAARSARGERVVHAVRDLRRSCHLAHPEAPGAREGTALDFGT